MAILQIKHFYPAEIETKIDALTSSLELLKKNIDAQNQNLQSINPKIEDINLLKNNWNYIQKQVQTQENTIQEFQNSYNMLCQKLEDVLKQIESQKTAIEEKMIEEIVNEYDSLQDSLNPIKNQMDSLTDDVTKYQSAFEECKNQIGSIKNVDDNVKISQKKQAFHMFLFFSTVIVLNIFYIWIITFRPDATGASGTGYLPWHEVLPLVAITLANIIYYANWFHPSQDFFGIYECLLEMGMLGMNLMFIWIAAFIPVEEITAKVIVLLIFLLFGNLLMLFTKILYFMRNILSPEDSQQKNIRLSVNIIGSILFICIVIFFRLVYIW